METTAAKTTAAAKPKKVPSTLLIGVLIVLMVGLGLGVYFKLKSKKDDPKDPTTTDTEDEDEDPSASGRTVTNHGFKLTDAEMKALLSSGLLSPAPGGKGSSTNPCYFKDPEFLEIVELEAIDMQEKSATNGVMDIVRSVYNIGEAMMGRDDDEQECIEELFEKLPNVDFSKTPDRKYLAFPVYGTNEINGAVYRAELQAIINAGWESLNLTRLRNSSNVWFCKEIGLNLLVGTTWHNTPTTHNVQFSFAPRSELDFYKKFNRYWVHDALLAEKYINRRTHQRTIDLNHPETRAAYCATGMFDFVQRWLREIDRLDEVTRIMAYKRIVYHAKNNPSGEWHVTTVNPETGEDENQKQG